MSELYSKAILALSILFLGTLLSLLIPKATRIILGRLSSRTKTDLDDFIVDNLAKVAKPLGIVLSVSISWEVISDESTLNNIVLGLCKLIIVILLIRFINKISLRLIRKWSIEIKDQAISTMLRSVDPMVRATIWGVGFVFYLQNIGVQMAAIWALLSAGGIGAGLALKEPVQEFFEYITILLDKPFVSGQFININDVWATVERVGVRSTRLRSLNGEIIVMSNSMLTNGVICNYTEMSSRRIVHRLGLVYGTSSTLLEKVPHIIKDVIDKTEDAEFDRCHFIQFGDSSLDFELVYFIPTNDYLRAMIAQQNINLEIIKSFESYKIEFAFPTQTVHISKPQD